MVLPPDGNKFWYIYSFGRIHQDDRQTPHDGTKTKRFAEAYLGGRVDSCTSSYQFIDDVDVTFFRRQVESSESVLLGHDRQQRRISMHLLARSHNELYYLNYGRHYRHHHYLPLHEMGMAGQVIQYNNIIKSKTMFMLLPCCHHVRAIARVHPVHLINVEWRQVAADPRPSQTT